MVLLYYILEIGAIFLVAFLLFVCYSKAVDFIELQRERKNVLAELKQHVRKTTPEKDAELSKIYSNNKTALKIIQGAVKDEAIELRSVNEIEHTYKLAEQEGIYELDRREQMSRYLQLKKDRRAGNIPQNPAKIIAIPTKEDQSKQQS